jgi:hypothetical protein
MEENKKENNGGIITVDKNDSLSEYKIFECKSIIRFDFNTLQQKLMLKCINA